MVSKSIYRSKEGKEKVLNVYSNILNKWAGGIEQINVATRYGNTFALAAGRRGAKVIVLLHGSSSNSAIWINDLQQLKKNYRVFAIDIIGECGRSSEQRPEFKDNHYSNWLLEVLDELGISKAYFIGNSLGGWIALDFAVKFPSRVCKLLLVATAGITHVRKKALFWLLFTFFCGRWGYLKINKLIYRDIEIEDMAIKFILLLKRYYIPRLCSLPLMSAESLGKLHMPVLFLGGEYDFFYNSAQTAKVLSNSCNSSKSIVLKDAGHALTNITKHINHFLWEDE